MQFIKHTPCTIITGFLGSGKTTTINHLLSMQDSEQPLFDEASTAETDNHTNSHVKNHADNKNNTLKWGLLINEFGQIGIDSSLVGADSSSQNKSSPNQDNPNNGNQDKAPKVTIREVNGGCICCTSQLPLQIALSRLLAENPSRVVIEPTGLAHPKQLIEQLSEPHWQTSLKLLSVICVLNARQWQDIRYREHDGYRAHVKYADVVLINRYQALQQDEREQLQNWINEINPHAETMWFDESFEQDSKHHLSQALNQPSQIMQQHQQAKLKQVRVSLATMTNMSTKVSIAPSISSLSSSPTPMSANKVDDESTAEVVELPYRYHDSQQGMMVGGWRLPASWIFDHDALQNWLLSLPNWQRIKGVVNTNYGWTKLNFTTDSLTSSGCTDQVDNRIEVILLDTALPDEQNNKDNDSQTQLWQQWDKQLLAMCLYKD